MLCKILSVLVLLGRSITEKYRTEPGLEPRVSLPTELSKPTQFSYSNFRVLFNYP